MERNIGNLDGSRIKIENIQPQRLHTGVYHSFFTGCYMTADVTWVDFSEFNTGAVSVEDSVKVSPEGIYDDIWAISLGGGYPLDDRTTLKLGLMYVSQAVDDDKRTLSLRLDELWATGVGIRKKLKDSFLDVNLNVYLIGDAPVDTGKDNALRGRIVGKNDNPYAFAIDAAWHW